MLVLTERGHSQDNQIKDHNYYHDDINIGIWKLLRANDW